MNAFATCGVNGARSASSRSAGQHRGVRSSRRRCALIAGLCAAFASLSVGTASAADIVKNNTSGLLNSGTSWVDGVAPGTSDVAVWNSTVTSANSPTYGGNLSWQGIKIVNPTGLVTLGNTGDTTTLTLGSAGIDMSGATQNLLINGNISVSGSQDWRVASGRTFQLFTVNTNRTMVGSGTMFLTNSSGAGTATFDLRPGSASSTAFTAQAGVSGYTGSWYIGPNTIVKTLRNGINAWGNGGTIFLAGGTVGQQQNFSGAWTNTMELVANTTSAIDDFNTSGSRYLQLNGVIQGSGNLTFQDTNSGVTTDKDITFTLAAANTMSGTVTVAASTFLRVGGVGGNNNTGSGGVPTPGTAGTLGTASVVVAGGLAFTRTNAITVSNTISGAGTVYVGSANANMTATATQDLTLSASNSYGGGTELLNGTLRVAALSGIGTGYLAVKNSGTFVYTGSGTESTTRVLWMNSGAATMSVSDAAGWLTMNPSGGTRNQSFTKAGAGMLEIGGAFVSDGTGTASVRVSGGTLRLTSAASTYLGTTTMVAGTLEVSKLANGGANSSIGASTNAATNLVFNGGALSYIGTGDSTNRAFTITSAPTINANGTGPLTWTGASPTFTTADTAYQVTLGGTNTGDNTFGTILADNGSGATSLRKAGTGKWVLSGVNTFTGTTGIAAGTLEIGGAGVLGSGSYAAAIVNTGTLSVATSANQTLAGVVSGGGGLAKSGAGRLTLTAANTYAGPTTITSGTVVVAGAGQLGAGSYAGAITNDGALEFTTSAAQSLSGGVGGTGALRQAGTGRLMLLGNNTYAGATTVDSGTLAVNGVVSASTITVNPGAVLGGSGTTAAVLLAGGAISPGNSPGTLTVGDLAWGETSSYTWELYDYQAGAGIGWDQIVGTGALTVTGTGFTFDLVSLSGTNTPGPAFSWSQTTSGTFRMGTFTSISAPSGTWWNLDTSGFTPYSATLGTFSLAVSPTAIDLVYTYTPPADAVWTAGTGAWSAAGNWTSAIVPSGTTAIIYSGAGGTSTNDLVSGTGAGELALVTGLTFSGSASGAATIDGAAFTLGSLGVVNQSSSQQTVATGLTLAAASLANADTAGLVLSGTIDTAGYGFTVTGSANTTISGVVTGSGGLAKLGAGTLTLTGANDFTGGTLITGGTVVVGDGGTTGVLPGTVTNNAALVFYRSDAVTASASIGGSGSLTKLGSNTLTLTGSNGYTGPTTIAGGTLAFASAANQTLTGAISGAGALAQAGAGRLALSGSNSYAGGTTITGGTLQLGSGGTTGSIAGDVVNDATLAFNRSDAVTFAGVISGAGGVAQVGPGSTTLTAVNTYAGNTTISSGTLAVGGAGQLGGGSYSGAIANAGVLSFQTSANQTLAGVVSGTGSLRQAGPGTLTLTGVNTYSGSTAISSGTLVVGGAGQLGGGSYAGAIANAGTLAIATSANQVLSGPITGGGTLVKSGAGTLTVSASNAIGAPVAVNGGTIRLGNGNALGAADTGFGKVVVGAGGAIDFNGSAATYGYTISGSGPAGAGALVNAGAALGTGLAQTSNIRLAADATVGGTADWGLIASGYAATTLDLNGFTLTKAGPNTVTLANATIAGSGTIVISQGTLSQFNTGATGTGATITLADSAATGLALNNLAMTVGALSGGGATGGTVSLGSATLTVGGLGTSTTYSGSIGGTGGLTKTGTGTLTLAGTSGYTGTTTVTAGTLAFTGNNSLGGGLSNGGGDTSAVVAFGANTVSVGTPGANAGFFYYGTLAGSGTLALRGGNGTVQNSDGTAGATTGNFQIFTTGTFLSPTAFALTTGPSTTDRRDFAYVNDVGTVLTLSSLSGFGAIRNDAGAASTRFITVDQAIDTTFNGALLSHRSGAGAARQLTFEKQGVGSLTLAGFIGKQTASAQAGASAVNLTANGGLLNVTNAANTTTTNTDAIRLGTVTITSGTLAFSAQALLNNAGTAGATSILMNGGVLRWNVGTTQDMTAGGRLTLVAAKTATFDTNGNDVTFGTALGGGAISAAVTKIGAGRLTLAANNVYTGPTTVSAGTLAIGAGGSAGSIAGDLVNDAVVIIDLDTAVTYAGAVSGSGTIVKRNANTLTLTGANTFSGSTELRAGTLAFANGALGTGTVAMLGGTLQWASGNTQDVSGQIGLIAGGTATLDTNGNDVTLAGSIGGGTSSQLVKAGAGTLALGGANDYTGGTRIDAGTLEFGTGGLGSTGTVALAAETVLRWAAGNTQDISPRLALPGSGGVTFDVGGNDVTLAAGLNAGGAGVTKSGAGTLTLAAPGGYTGSTVIAAGTLALSGSGSIAGSSFIDIGSGATLDIAGAQGLVEIGTIKGSGDVQLGGNTLRSTVSTEETFAGTISGSGGFTKAGGATLFLTSLQALTGPVTVADGLLNIAPGTVLTTASRIDVAGGATLESEDVIVIVDGQALGGNGTVAGDVLFESGATVAPGGSVGTLADTGNVTFNAGTIFEFEINDAEGDPGAPAAGWDLFTVSGSVTLAASEASRIVVNVTSLSGTATGSAVNFDAESNYAWLFLTSGASSPIEYDSNWFDVDTTDFLNLMDASERFAVVRGDDLPAGFALGTSSELYVVYAAIPEPAAATLAAIGVAAAAWAARRHRGRTLSPPLSRCLQ